MAKAGRFCSLPSVHSTVHTLLLHFTRAPCVPCLPSQLLTAAVEPASATEAAAGVVMVNQLASDVNDAEEAELRRLESGAPPPAPASTLQPPPRAKRLRTAPTIVEMDINSDSDSDAPQATADELLFSGEPVGMPAGDKADVVASMFDNVAKCMADNAALLRQLHGPDPRSAAKVEKRKLSKTYTILKRNLRRNPSYQLFMAGEVEALKASHYQLGPKEIMAEVIRRWQQLGHADKATWRAKAARLGSNRHPHPHPNPNPHPLSHPNHNLIIT